MLLTYYCAENKDLDSIFIYIKTQVKHVRNPLKPQRIKYSSIIYFLKYRYLFHFEKYLISFYRNVTKATFFNEANLHQGD